MGYYFTRRSLAEIREIYRYSLENWGEYTARAYLSKIYNAISKIVNNPKLGNKTYAPPFLMVLVERHYIVYEIFRKDIIIIAVPHAKQNMEQLMARLEYQLIVEAEEIKKHINTIH